MNDDSEPPKKKLKTGSHSSSSEPDLFEKVMSQRDLAKTIMGHLEIPDLFALSNVSRTVRGAVLQDSVLPRLQGMRQIDSRKFWTTDSAAEAKRYFKPMSVFGETRDVPHVSEQSGHTPHVTDVGLLRWPQSGPLPAGDHPSKLQYSQTKSRRNSYELGAVNIPKKPQDGRVLMRPHANANEGSDIFIESKSYNKSEKGPLPPSYPRTRLNSAERMRTLDQSRGELERKSVKRYEKP